MFKKHIYLKFTSIIFMLSSMISAQTNNDWIPISGKWNIGIEEITPNNVDNSRLYLIKNKRKQRSDIWESISCDIKVTKQEKESRFGFLLNVKDDNDYQVVRFYNDSINPRIQFLHYKYGRYNLWNEFKLSSSFKPGLVYNVAITRAPLVDKEDWRPWKIIITNKTDNNILLKTGIDNIQPAIGKGITGLYTNTKDVVFSDYTLNEPEYFRKGKELVLAPLFADRMVLQRQSKIKFWGDAHAKEKIRLEIADQTYSTYSDKNGNWILYVLPLEVQTGLTIKVFSEKDSLIINDVAVGEVWMASGQSNMEMRAWQSDVSKNMPIDDDIRFFIQPHWPSFEACFSSGGKWIKADSTSAPGFSAIAISFAKELKNKLNVPIGIISSNWGGTAIESWFPSSELATNPVTSPILEQIKQYKAILEKGKQVKASYPMNWYVPGQMHTPGWLYNGMIAPHIPYAIKGVIWYQGESNAFNAKRYKELFPMLIKSWRKKWKKDDMYFCYVQLSGYDGKESDSDIKDAWPYIRDVQRLTLDKFNNVGMAVSLDLGEEINIHPYRKNEVGVRLSRLALHDVYKFNDIVRSGPLYESLTGDKNNIIVHFSDTGDKLKVLKDEKNLKGFYIAGKNGAFIPAKAVIMADKKSVKVSSEKVKHPVAVRYGWGNFPSESNLGNSANLPASPFRTDDYALELERK